MKIIVAHGRLVLEGAQRAKPGAVTRFDADWMKYQIHGVTKTGQAALKRLTRRLRRYQRKCGAYLLGKTLKPTASHVELVYRNQLLSDVSHHMVHAIARLRGISQRDAARQIVHTMLRWGVDFRRAKWIEYIACDKSRLPGRTRQQDADMLRKHKHWPLERDVMTLVHLDTLAFGGEWQYLKGHVVKHDNDFGDKCMVSFQIGEHRFIRIIPFRNLKPVWNKQ